MIWLSMLALALILGWFAAVIIADQYLLDRETKRFTRAANRLENPRVEQRPRRF